MILKIYQILTVLFSPIIDLYLFIRLLRGKEDRQRFRERLGYTEIKRPDGDLIWFQCASVGESNSALPLIEKIIAKYNGKITILITSGTKTSADILEKKLVGRNNIIHQYTSVDKYFVIKRFLKFWKPKALITIESEIWPNMITMSHKYCEKVMIVNAKISTRSFIRWKKFKKFKEAIFDSIDVCYPQSEEDQYRLINLGIQNTLFLGNLKFDIPKLKVNQEYFETLKGTIGNRRFVLFASAHADEEKVIANVYKKLNEKYSDLLFIVALRHPNKSDEIYNFLMSNLEYVKRKSKDELIDMKTNIYMYDEMGEMGTLFELSNIVVMCGSLVPKIGGHTPVEAAKHNCAIITGPYIESNRSLFKELRSNQACIICNKKENLVDQLFNNISDLFENPMKVDTLKGNAYAVCNEFSNVAENVARSIMENLAEKS